jgi:hypothetical protein
MNNKKILQGKKNFYLTSCLKYETMSLVKYGKETKNAKSKN